MVNAAVGQENGSREHLKIAQQYFQLVGGSASECDTIPGRFINYILLNFYDITRYFACVGSAWRPAFFS